MKEMREVVMQTSGERTFQAERTHGAKALTLGVVKRSLQPKGNEKGGEYWEIR